MPIYTKKGDKGYTDLFDLKTGKKIRTSKKNKRIEAIGSIDELNSVLGIIKSLLKDKKEISFLERIQKDLFLINSCIAGIKGLNFSKNKAKYLEVKIDLLEKKLPKLNNFILPGGSFSSSVFHLARSITRRAERNIVHFSEKEEINTNILVFINRLSDLFFILARWEDFSEGKKETLWGK